MLASASIFFLCFSVCARMNEVKPSAFLNIISFAPSPMGFFFLRKRNIFRDK